MWLRMQLQAKAAHAFNTPFEQEQHAVVRIVVTLPWWLTCESDDDNRTSRLPPLCISLTTPYLAGRLQCPLTTTSSSSRSLDVPSASPQRWASRFLVVFWPASSLLKATPADRMPAEELHDRRPGTALLPLAWAFPAI